MPRLLMLAAVLSACTGFPDRPPVGVNPDPDRCATFTGAILEPANGATVREVSTVHVQWPAEIVFPDRYTLMADDSGALHLQDGPDERQSDGSVRILYELPPGEEYLFEIGWTCGGLEIPLARVRFSTEP